MFDMKQSKAGAVAERDAGAEWVAAEARWRAASGKMTEMRHQVKAMENALCFTRSNGWDTVSEALRSQAEPWRTEATRSPHRLRERLSETRFAIQDYESELEAERLAYETAARVETDRIALARKAAHRDAARRIAEALEALCAALRDERAARAGLGPLPTSGYLPDLDCDLAIIGDPADYDSPAWRWVRRAHELGVLEGK